MPVNPPYKDHYFDLPGVCRADSATLQPQLEHQAFVCNPIVPSIRLPPTSTKFLPASDSYNNRRCQWHLGAVNGQWTVGAEKKTKVYRLTTALAIGHSSSTAGRNYALSRLHRTERSNSRPQSPGTVHPQGIHYPLPLRLATH